MGLQRHPFKDYTGGLNLRDGPINLESDECQDARNVQLTLRGALQQRPGKSRFDESGYPGSSVADNLRNWYNAGSDLLIASIDGDIYSFTGGGVGTLRFNGTAGSVWCFEDAEDNTGASTLWAMNGVDAAQKWDGVAANTSAWAGTPPDGTMIRMWRNRMIVSGVAATPQRVFFSAIGNPESFTTATDFIDIKTTDDDLDPVTWLDVIGDYLVVFKRRSTWVVIDPVTFANRRVDSPGCIGRFLSAELLGNLYFVADDGVYSTNGNSLTLESDLISSLFTAKSNPIGTINKTQINKWRLIATRDRRLLLALPIGAATANDLLLEYIPELRKRRENGETTSPWMAHDLTVSSMANLRIAGLDTVVAGQSSGSEIHKLFQGLSDDGVAINAFYFGSWRAVFPEEPFERVRRINVEHTGRVVVELFRDFDSDAPTHSKTLETPVDPDPLWDGGVWDGGTWDPLNPTQLGRSRPDKRARYHAVKFSNNALNKSFTIYSAELAIRGGKEHT